MSRKEELAKFTATSIRGPQLGTRESLLVTKLWHANRSKPLQRIIYICQAAWFSKEFKKSSVDSDVADVLYQVATALSNVKSSKEPYNYGYMECYTIPWSFSQTEENFETFIKPWVKDYEHFKDLVASPMFVDRTAIMCGHCEGTLLDVSGKRSMDGMRGLVWKKFKSEIQVVKELLISKEQLRIDRGVAERLADMFSYRKYRPPLCIRTFFLCPGCDKEILLSKEYTPDSHGFHRITGRSNEKKCDLELENYRVLHKDWEFMFFFTATQFLTRKGYYQLVNSFVSYADPLATEMEAKIAALVSPEAWHEFVQKKGEEEDLR